MMSKHSEAFLLVFFSEEDQTQNNNNTNFNFLSPSSSSINNLIHKAQSTISICLLLLFTTLLLFTLSTLPSAATARRLYAVPRRNLWQSPPPPSSPSNLPHALQGMGTLYRRGTKAMNDVVIAHAHESLSQNDLKLFLRLFFRSSLASRSDLLLIFPSKTAKLDNLILREHDSFFKLLTQYNSSNGFSHSKPSFGVAHFTKMGKRERESGEPIWGQKTRTEEGGPESSRASYGSVVGFDVDELDPENSLSGFVDHAPMSLRRWACYPILLGRVKRHFKHVMLVDIKDILLLGDPLFRVRSHSPESVLLKAAKSQSNSDKHGKRNSDKTESARKNLVHPGIVMGGLRGVRKLSNAVLTDIVRASIQDKKKKNYVTESAIFRQLVGNDRSLKSMNLIVSTESLPEMSSIGRSRSKSVSHLFTRNYGLIRRGNSNVDVNSIVMKHICSFPIDAAVYRDCSE